MTEESRVFEAAAALSKSGSGFVLARIVTSFGSVPRTRARMLISESGTVGTIGGGALESLVVQEARTRMASAASGVARFDVGSRQPADFEVGMECGGRIDVEFDVVEPSVRLIIVGAGHVGIALARAASSIGWMVTLVDTRPDLVSADRLPDGCASITAQKLEDALVLTRHRSGDCVVIATHADDETALRHFIGKDLEYIGMVGSEKKVKRMFARLRSEGISAEALQAVKAPVGLDIGSETPAEIAISILAEIMSTLRGANGKPLSETADRN